MEERSNQVTGLINVLMKTPSTFENGTESFTSLANITPFTQNSLFLVDENVTMSTASVSGLRQGFFTTFDDYALGISFLLIAVLGITLNALTMFVVGFGKYTSPEIKIQLINLAMADFLSALFLPAYSAAFLLYISFPSSLALCKIVRIIGWGAFYTSPLWNVTISLERLVVVYFPLKAVRYTPRHKLIIAGMVWFCGFSTEIESLLYSELTTRTMEYNVTVCSVNSPLSNSNVEAYETLLTIKYTLPAIIMVVAYFLIGIKLNRWKAVGERSLSTRKAEARACKVKTQVLIKMRLCNTKQCV